MSRSMPKFALGEAVIVRCSVPAFNGPAVVIRREFLARVYNVRTQKDWTGWAYKVDKPMPIDIEWYGEKVLRKRPADQSFDELMCDLTQPLETVA